MHQSSSGTITPSPCIGTCKLNDQKICTGCLRTLSEIEAWADADENTRQDILEQVAKRNLKAT